MSAEDNISCNDSLIEALEAQGGFHPLETRKRLEPGEGLTKIWMCPSSEMATALFSTKPAMLHGANLGRESLNLIEKLNFDRKKSLDSENGSGSSGSLGSEWTYDEGDMEQSDTTSIKVDRSTQGPSESSYFSLPDERIDNLKRSLKQMYDEKLAAGANMLVNYSLELMDNQMYNLVKEIREQEENRIENELNPIVEFIEKHKVEVNRENGSMLKRKYRTARRAGITRLVDVAEESFTHRCLQIEKKLLEKFNFRVEKMKNNHYVNYRERLRVDLKKWVGKFKEERNKIMKDYETATASIREEYDKMYNEQKAIELSKVQEEVEKIKECTAMFEAADKTEETKEPYEKCSEESGWLCVLHQLLNDMQLFMKTYISSEADVRQLLNKIKQQKEANYRKKTKLKSRLFALSTEDVIISDKEPSVMTIPCIRDRDEELHQVLLQEAGLMLEKILSDLSQGRVTKEDFDLIWRHIHRSTYFDDATRILLKRFPSDEDCSQFNFSLFNQSDDSKPS